MQNKESKKELLLNCPFCGGEATTHSTIALSKGEYRRLYGVMCKNTYCCYIPPSYYEYEEAIKKWNTRKPMQEIVERLEEERKDCVNYDGLNEEYYFGKMQGFEHAIEIVKEVGGMND